MSLAPQASVRVPLADLDPSEARGRIAELVNASGNFSDAQEVRDSVVFADRGGSLTTATEYTVEISVEVSGIVGTVTATSTGFAIGDLFGLYRRRALKVASLLSESNPSVHLTDKNADESRAELRFSWMAFGAASVLIGVVVGLLGRLSVKSVPLLAVPTLVLLGVILMRKWSLRRRR